MGLDENSDLRRGVLFFSLRCSRSLGPDRAATDPDRKQQAKIERGGEQSRVTD
jgi:hypothetical protein